MLSKFYYLNISCYMWWVYVFFLKNIYINKEIISRCVEFGCVGLVLLERWKSWVVFFWLIYMVVIVVWINVKIVISFVNGIIW